jgi:hypothetical protein
MRTRLLSLGLALVIAAVAGCASSAPPPPPASRPTTDALDGVRRVVLVASGESQFTVVQGSKEPGPELEEVLKWLPYKEILVPLARAVYWGVTWLLDTARASDTVSPDVAPGAVVADAFARTMLASGGPFDQILAMDSEPVGEARRNAEAIVRLSVPSWGLLRVRQGTPSLVAAFADVRAEIVLRETGVVVWRYEEDVTHPETLPLDALRGDRALARDQLTGVLERAGRRVASELIYARSGRQ